MSAALPPLPEVGYLGDDASYGYDANDMAEYATAARADLEAENKRLREALKELLAAHELGVLMSGRGLDKARTTLKEQP